MSILCTDVENSVLTKKAALYGVREFVYATIDPNTRRDYPFPSDYEFTPCFLPKKYAQVADGIHNFPIRSDDIWTVSFPKAGSTWVANIIWQLMNNMDFSAEFLLPNHMFLEPMIFNEVNDNNRSDDGFKEYVKFTDGQLDRLGAETTQRFLKSHLPAHLLPKQIWTVKPKLIYAHRNAKDVAISWFHMFRKLQYTNYSGSLDDYIDTFLNDHALYTPFHSHVKCFQKLNHLDHVLIVNYEEMIANPFAGIKRISEFLNCTYDDDELNKLTEHVSFQNMRSKATKLPFSDGCK